MELYNVESYEAFKASLHIGDEFVACYLSDTDVATRGTSNIKKRFVISKIYEHVMEVQTLRHVKSGAEFRRFRVICYVNIKELYCKGANLVILPTRQEREE